MIRRTAVNPPSKVTLQFLIIHIITKDYLCSYFRFNVHHNHTNHKNLEDQPLAEQFRQCKLTKILSDVQIYCNLNPPYPLHLRGREKNYATHSRGVQAFRVQSIQITLSTIIPPRRGSSINQKKSRGDDIIIATHYTS